MENTEIFLRKKNLVADFPKIAIIFSGRSGR